MTSTLTTPMSGMRSQRKKKEDMRADGVNRRSSPMTLLCQ